MQSHAAKKRERNANFSNEEIGKLVSLVELQKETIECKKCDAATWQKKEQAWKTIEMQFNNEISLATKSFREAKHLKAKYDALKKETRKKARNSINGKASGVMPLSPLEQKVIEIMSVSFEGCDFSYESDPDLLDDKPDDIKNEPAEYDMNGFTEVIIQEGDTKDLLSDNETTDSKKSEKELLAAKLDVMALQKHLIKQDIVDKKIRMQMLREEREHKREMYELEKSQLLEEIKHKREIFELEKTQKLEEINHRKEMYELEWKRKKKNLNIDDH